VTAHSRVSDGCDMCDGFVQSLATDLPALEPSGSLCQREGVSLSKVCNYPSNPSHPSLVRGLDVTTPVPPVTEALAKDTVILEAGVERMATEEVPQHEMPSQGHVLAQGPDTRWAVQTTEMPTGWPLAQCTRADPSPPVHPPPCAACGGVERWDDQGTMRCVTCWPWEGSQTHARADAATSTPGATTVSMLASEALRGHRS